MKLLRILHDDRSVPSRKHVVMLSEAERGAVRRLLAHGTADARSLSHARILLKADASAAGPAWTDERIRDACEVGLATVVRVRRAFVAGGLDAALHRAPTTRRYRRALDGRQGGDPAAPPLSAPPGGEAPWGVRG